MQLITLPTNDSMQILTQFTPTFLLVCGLILITAYYSASKIGVYCSQRWGGNEAKAKILCQGIMLASVGAFIAKNGVSMLTLQALAYCGVCLFSSYSDFKTRTLDDSAHCVILGIAFMGRTINDIPAMIIAALVIGGITLFAGTISKGSGIGGADIKFAAASALMLGLETGLAGTMLGLLIGVIVAAIKNHKAKKKMGFPLVPYMSIGYMTAMFVLA